MGKGKLKQDPTSANLFEKEKPFFCVLSEGTKYVLNAPGKDWNRDLSIPRVRICNKNEKEEKRTEFITQGYKNQQAWLWNQVTNMTCPKSHDISSKVGACLTYLVTLNFKKSTKQRRFTIYPLYR